MRGTTKRTGLTVGRTGLAAVGRRGLSALGRSGLSALGRSGLSALAAVLAFGPVAAFGYTVEAPGLESLLAGNYEKGMKALREAAQRGDGAANSLLGSIYSAGFGVPANREAATKWFEAGSKGKDKHALRLLGHQYWKGRFVPRDEARAAQLLRRSADQGDAFGQYLTGWFMVQGIGGPKKAKEGIKWLTKSNKQGYVWATSMLATIASGSKKHSTQQLSVKLTTRAALTGLPSAQRKMARRYYKGRGVPQDYKLAYVWASTAARLGDKDAQLLAGYMSWNGLGTKKNRRRALGLYRLSAEQGVAGAMYNLGVSYRARSKRVAHRWFNLAASRGHKRAAGARDKLARTMTPRDVELAQRAAASWRVKKRLKNMKVRGTGTGFFINVTHTVVTNEHVVANCGRVAIHANKKLWPNVTILGADRVNDLALLSVRLRKGENLRHRVARIAPPGDAELGEAIVVFGYPLGKMLSASGVLTTGTLNANEGYRGNKNRLQIQAPIQPGNSGSAVLDERGRVIGVVSSQLKQIKRGGRTIVPQNVNFAVKAQILRRMLERFHQAQYPHGQTNGEDAAPLSTKKRVRIARGSAVRVLCYRY